MERVSHSQSANDLEIAAAAADLSDLFCNAVEAFANALAKEGYDIRPYNDRSSLYFSKLAPLDQQRVLDNFRRYSAVCGEVHAEGKSLKDDRYVLWRMIQRLGLRPSSTLFQDIESEDFIEIYDAEFIQVFRNMKFFAVCSYTLDEILSRPWWELYKRDEAITSQLMSLASQVFSGTYKGILYFNLGVHVLEEIDSKKKNRAVIENKFFAPLFSSTGGILAAVNVIRDVSGGILTSSRRGTRQERILEGFSPEGSP